MKRLDVIGLLLGLSLVQFAHATVSPPAEGIVPARLLLAQAGTGQAPKAKPVPSKKAAIKKPAAKPAKKVASKTPSRKQADAVANALPKPKLDLSLPKDMVQTLQPEAKVHAGAASKPVLPEMFEQKQADGFQLNGRLLSNEMGLNLRTDARRDVEGAALDFKFPQ